LAVDPFGVHFGDFGRILEYVRGNQGVHPRIATAGLSDNMAAQELTGLFDVSGVLGIKVSGSFHLCITESSPTRHGYHTRYESLC
jgi:hypothetical protein